MGFPVFKFDAKLLYGQAIAIASTSGGESLGMKKKSNNRKGEKSNCNLLYFVSFACRERI